VGCCAVLDPPEDAAPPGGAASPDRPAQSEFSPSSHAFLEAVHRGLDAGVHAIDEEGRVQYLNAAAEALHGWTHAELAGRGLHEALHHEHGRGSSEAADACLIAEVAVSGQATSGEAVFRRRDGSVFPVLFTAEPITSDGRVTGAVVLFRHSGTEERALAAERETEALRGERSRLAQLDQVKSTFLNLVAHELRGPLAVARGYVSMLEEGTFGPPDAADLRPAIPMVAAKLAEMNTLVDQMLETARLESGKLHLAAGPVRLGEVVEEALAAQLTLAASNRVRVVQTTAADQVHGDRARLRTVITNLLDNARKYSAAGSAIEVEVARDGGVVVASIRDHGLGIAPEHRSQLFTRFGRIVTPDNSHIPGSGLGLHLCRELARMHGGDLTVVSSPGEGSTFSLRLPAAD
ncbi:MAG: ATP-binding protein, partial [Candidatus Dormibacteria bacterium]